MPVLRSLFTLQGQAADCHNLVPIGFDGFVDDADVTEIGLLDSLITSVCAGKLPDIFVRLPVDISRYICLFADAC